MNNNLAPIVLFVYNRLEHTKKTVEALQKNNLSKESILYIYSDGYKSPTDKEKVLEVRKYIQTISGFKHIYIKEQNKNKGLANSIIEGITFVVNKHDKVIVLEDDIVTSPFFLDFLNSALTFYEYYDKVWHISGWNYPIKEEGLKDTFFWQMMNCWGWGTWKDRWKYFEKNIQKNIAEFPLERIKEFNLEGFLGNWQELVENLPCYRYDTWAIFWHLAIFKNNGFCLNPTISFVKNIGFDNSGINTDFRTHYNIHNLNIKKNINFELPTKIEVNQIALKRVQNFYNYSNEKTKQYYNNKSFTRLYNNLNTQIMKLDKNHKFIIYGGGLVAELIITKIKDNIIYIVDKDEKKVGTKLNGLKINSIDQLKFTNDKIIISVLGREDEIIEYLTLTFHLPEDNIITFSL